MYWAVAVFSFFANLLMLTGPLYVRLALSRSLSSGSVENAPWPVHDHALHVLRDGCAGLCAQPHHGGRRCAICRPISITACLMP